MTSRSARTRARQGLSAIAALALALSLLVPGGQTPADATTPAPCAPAEPGYGGGAGTSEDPYLIASADHLAHLAATSTDWGKHFVQTANIDLSGCLWTMIGTSPTAFAGSYDGGGYTISGLRIDGTSSTVGLFGVVAAGATLREIHLVEPVVEGDVFVGGLVGELAGSLEKVSVSGGSIKVEGNLVGGVVGFIQSSGEVRDAHFSGTVNAVSENGINFAGGLAGNNSGEITSSSAVGAVTSTGNIVGGLVGGNFDEGSISSSFATGDVEGANSVGGLVGFNQGTIADSFATGAVTGADEVGGLVGLNTPATDGEDSPTSPAKVTNAFSIGLVTGPAEGSADVGGLIGKQADGTIEGSFWDVTTSKLEASAGGEGAVGKSTADMKLLATYAGADWAIVAGRGVYDPPASVWGICEQFNDGYPYLLWQTLPESACPVAAGDDAQGAATSGAVSATPLIVDGSTPSLPTGTALWQQADGTPVPLAVSSPAPGQVRYEAEGVTLTLTGAAGTSVANGLVANAAGEVECEICAALAAGQVIEAWMFSEPRLVAAWRVEDLPCQTFTIPVGAPLDGGDSVSAGAHTLQLAMPTASGMQAVNVGVTVGGPVPASVPAGEGSVPSGVVLLGLIGAAGAVVAGRRMVTAG